MSKKKSTSAKRSKAAPARTSVATASKVDDIKTADIRITPPAKPKKKRHIVLYALGAVFLVATIGGGIAWARFSSFKEATFSGRDETSLLEATPTTLAPTTTPLPPTTIAATSKPGLMTLPTVAPTRSAAPTATPVVNSEILRKVQAGYKVTMLVIGYGGGNHDGAYLADTIMQITIDPQKKAVSMVNIPRDLLVFVPYGGKNVGFNSKINASFAYVMNSQDSSGLSSRYRFNSNDLNSKIDSAAILTKDVVEQVTGVPVDYWAAVSFDGFRSFIDAIGGIMVDVDTAFDDYEYPANDDPNIDASVIHLHFDAGLQAMDGNRAIQYARSRHSAQDGSDFGRSKRQMKVVAAVKEKASKPDVLLKAFSIMDALQGKVRTSFKFDEVLELANYVRGNEGAALANGLYFVPNIISTSNFLSGGSSYEYGSYLVPQNGQGNYTAIRNWVRAGIQAPELRYENLTVQVRNATGLSRPATSATEAITQRGFTTLYPEWLANQSSTVIIDYTNGVKSSASVKALQSLFPTASIKTMSPPYKGYAGPSLVVELGKDNATYGSDTTSPPDTDSNNTSQTSSNLYPSYNK